MDVAEAHPQAALPKLSAVTNDANKAGFKYLSLLSAIYQAKAFIEMKNFPKAAETLQGVLVQTEKLGLGSLKAQATPCWPLQKRAKERAWRHNARAVRLSSCLEK